MLFHLILYRVLESKSAETDDCKKDFIHAMHWIMSSFNFKCDYVLHYIHNKVDVIPVFL